LCRGVLSVIVHGRAYLCLKPGRLYFVARRLEHRMKKTLKALRRERLDRLVIESVDLSLYIAHAEVGGERYLVAGKDGSVLKTKNLLDMKAALADLDASERLLSQRSPYDEMVGQGFRPADNSMEIPLGPGFETLPPWQH
jgi:hypothetical protein